MYGHITVRVYSIAEIIYRCGPLRKLVTLNIQFCRKKGYFGQFSLVNQLDF